MRKMCQLILTKSKFIGFVDELHITPTKRWTALPAKHCTVCGIEYVPGSAISKYCPVCARKVRLERSNESRRRSREQKKMLCIELSAKNDRLASNSGRGAASGRGTRTARWPSTVMSQKGPLTLIPGRWWRTSSDSSPRS